VEHQQSGYLARPYEPDDLARGIAWVLEDDERLARLGHRCREKAEQEFGLELQARRYRALYEDILTQHRR
jgi:glycosyltransferase involved in cell wall biosynthesis